MSPEEFDNRLRATFKDENLPPKENMWQNINNRLDQKPSLSIWHWMTPLLLVITAGIVWLGANLLTKPSTETAVQTEQTVSPITPQNTESKPDKSAETFSDNSQTSSDKTESTKNDNTPKISENNDVKTSSNKAIDSKPNHNNLSTNSRTHNTTNNNSNIGSNTRENTGSSNTSSSNFNHSNTVRNNSNIEPSARKPFSNLNTPSNSNLLGMNHNIGNNLVTIDDNQEKSNRKLSAFYPFSNVFEFESNLNLVTPYKPEITKKERVRRAIESSGDFSESKWWFNIGIGPQTNINKIVTIGDSMDYVHKDLWSIRDKMSSNGLGFHLFTNIQKKFGKKNQFSFETGLEYSNRKEDIKFTDYSYDIRISDPNGKTLAYFKSLGYFTYAGVTSTFALTEGFTYIKKNKYTAITVPFRFNYELGISPNSFVSLGLGGGMSYINSQQTGHYSMTQQKEFFLTKKFFTASTNTRLSLYTNYNAMVQLGIYGGCQMYMNPLNVHNQYKIQMSDIQYGFSCRIPLDTK